MARSCVTCAHPSLTEIDRAIVAGEPLTRVAVRFGLTESTIRRHSAEHIPDALAKSQQAADVARADSLIDRLRGLGKTTMEVLKEARDEKDGEIALKAIARCEKQIELMARLLGELNESPTVQISLSPEWLALRGRLLAALEPYPDARTAVAKALAEGQ